MEITITDEAAAKIKEKTEGMKGYLKLKYNTDGCGCAVNGVVELWFVSEIEKDDVAIDTNEWPVFLEKAKTLYFDEKMKIHFSKDVNSFQLISPQQILNGFMKLVIMNA